MSIATRPAINKNQLPNQMPSNQFGWNLIGPIAAPASIENAQIGQIAQKTGPIGEQVEHNDDRGGGSEDDGYDANCCCVHANRSKALSENVS